LFLVAANITELLEKDPRKRLGSRGSADVMAHPWFTRGEDRSGQRMASGRQEGGLDGTDDFICCVCAGGVEWDVMIADAVEPPFVPNQDINAASQSAIGSFNDENQYRKVCNL